MKDLIMDGDYVNVSRYSDTKLGKILSPSHSISVETLFGKIGTMRSAMEYIVTPNYPTNLLSKRNLTKHDINKIPKQKIDVPNYWAVVTYLLCLRIKEDVEIIEMINDLDDECVFVSYNKVNCNKLGIKTSTYKPNTDMNMYVHILDSVRRLIRQGVFYDTRIQELIISYKDDKNKSVFDGLAIIVESDL